MVALVVVLFGLGLMAGGIFEIVVVETGTPARARIIECHNVGVRYHTDSCTGIWIAGGPLVGGNGHVVTGTVDGANSSDVGRTIDVRLSGSRAYTLSLRVPIILLVLGSAMLAVGFRLVWTTLRRRAASPAPTT